MYLIVNFITKLLLVAGKDVILMVCNWLSKMVYFVAPMECYKMKVWTDFGRVRVKL